MSRIEFPFDFDKYFTSEEDSADCVPACVSMCAKYWNDKIPSLKLPTKSDMWKQYFEKLHLHSFRGTNVGLVNNALKKLNPKNKIHLKADLIYPKHLNDLTKLFELDTPFPVILTYDKRMVLNNAHGATHASLFHSMDLQKDQVYVIDPMTPLVKEPYPHPKDFFLRGWETTENETIIVHPSNLRIPINMRKQIKDGSMDSFMRVKK